jgi:hypothetical protein
MGFSDVASAGVEPATERLRSGGEITSEIDGPRQVARNATTPAPLVEATPGFGLGRFRRLFGFFFGDLDGPTGG